VRGLGLLGVGFDLVLHSPWVRAAETAALLAPLAEGPAQATIELAREPSADLIAMLDALTPERVALVGHEPWLSDLIAWLVMGDSGLGFAFPLKKGGVAHLEGRPVPGAMRLGDLWRPRTLRDLGART
jgi:phosphohistidine phosphatase